MHKTHGDYFYLEYFIYKMNNYMINHHESCSGLL
jgi:hypothetical protein